MDYSHKKLIKFSVNCKEMRKKLSKDDISGTELGWFSVYTTEKNIERPITIVSMVEDVKGRGGSGYVVKKDSRVINDWINQN